MVGRDAFRGRLLLPGAAEGDGGVGTALRFLAALESILGSSSDFRFFEETEGVEFADPLPIFRNEFPDRDDDRIFSGGI